MSPLPPEIEQQRSKINKFQSRIKEADALEEARRVDETFVAYNACLQFATQERIPFMNSQLAQIGLGIGFYFSERND